MEREILAISINVIVVLTEEYGPAEDEILRHRHFHCHPGGRIELDRVSDRCCEEKHHYCHEFYDAFGEPNTALSLISLITQGSLDCMWSLGLMLFPRGFT